MSMRFLKQSKMTNCALQAELLKTNYFLKIYVFQSNYNSPIFITLLFTCLQIPGKPLTTDMLRIFMEEPPHIHAHYHGLQKQDSNKGGGSFSKGVS